MKSTLDARLLDRLIDGELNSAERRDTLRLIDATPNGWRRCALAFLEAQEFSQAARSLTIEPVSVPLGPTSPRTRDARSPSPRRWALAGSILALTFLAGFAARGRSDLQVPSDTSGQAMTTTVSPAPIEDRSRLSPGLASVSSPSAVIPDYVRSQWERQGYQIEQKRKAISVDLDDVGRVTIPFDDVEFRFVGQQTY